MLSRAASGISILVCLAGAAVGVLGLVILSLRRRLANARFRLQTVLDQLYEGVVLLDRDCTVVQTNRVAADLLGVREGLRLEDGSKLFRMLGPDGTETPTEAWPSAMAAKQRYVKRAEYQIVSELRGKELRVEMTTAPLPDRRGVGSEVVMIFNDITQTRQAFETSSRLMAIVEGSDDAIMSKSLDGIVRSWNGGAQRVFGYTAEEMVGQSVKKLLPPERMDEEDELLEEIQCGRSLAPFDTLRQRKDGKVIQVSLAVSPIRGPDGRIAGASQIAHDITEQRQMESHLRQSQKMEAIGQLSGGIAHDFNNILGVVIGSLDLLERQLGGNAAALARVGTARKASARGADLARRLLAASSGGALRPARVKLADSIGNAVELGARALGPEYRLEVRFEDEIPPVFLDPGGFEVAMLNVLVNARDAMPRGGTIKITAQLSTINGKGQSKHRGELKAGRYACVAVADSGTGMTRDVMERAFEPFYTTKERGKGTGLGLAMVYGFFRQSGGTVHLYSEPGYGTTVSMYLPLAAEDDAGPAQPSLVQGASRGTGRLLVVDDETDLLEIATAYLTEAGYEVLTAENAASALEVLRAHPEVEMLVTDVLMPGGKNGFDLAQAAREMRPGLPVVYCSGFPMDSLAERKIVLDGPFLRKPYESEHLVSMVRETLAAFPSPPGQIAS